MSRERGKTKQLKLSWLLAFCLSRVASLLFGDPSGKMKIIIVTGTKGKFSTVQMIAQILENLDRRVGYISTTEFYIAGRRIKNKKNVTMLGHFSVQCLLRKMYKSGCTFVVIETCSGGIRQNRHLGINFDVVTYTNLTSEHIGLRDSFDNYKKKTGELFSRLNKNKRKKIGEEFVDKCSIINADDYYAPYFLSFDADRQITYSQYGQNSSDHFVIKNIGVHPCGLEIIAGDTKMCVPYIASFQQNNAISAICVVVALGYSFSEIVNAVRELEPINGRFEKVDAGQNYCVIIDCADEPYAVHALLDSVKILDPKRIIGVHGVSAINQDSVYRNKIGRIVSEHEDFVIITDNDFNSDSAACILEDTAKGSRTCGMRDGLDLFPIIDRERAIEKAIRLAQEGDIVLITGLGSEMLNIKKKNKVIEWSDRDVAIRCIKNK
jgi:UDP-N-acetylmuramoyl-L-alanyl-D-glutamate-L-lysine ligase